MSMPSFITEDASDGPVSTSWGDFKSPKLWKFSPPSDHIEWLEYLGSGEDGIIFKVRFGQEEPVAMKIFWLIKRPRADILPGGRPLRRYWSFEKECLNLAIIDKIKSAIRKAEDDPSQKIILKSPKNRQDAVHNLRAFSDEARLSPTRPQQPISPPPFPNITTCYGWTKIKRDDIPRLRPPVWNDVDEDVDWHWAIIYEFVPPLEQDIETGQAHLDFFYLTGFSLEPYRYMNWRGGRLVDFGDLAVPIAFPHLWWDKYGNCPLDAEKWFRTRSCTWLGRKHDIVRR